jgi:hypothetical protein
MSPGDRISKGLDFMLKDIAPKGKNVESRGVAHESGVMTPKSEVVTQETRAASPESVIGPQDSGVVTRESANIMPEAVVRHESGITTPGSDVRPPDSSVTTRDSGNVTRESEVMTHVVSQGTRVRAPDSFAVPDDIIDQAVAKALQSPKISLYSPLLLAVLESQQLTLLNHKEMTLLHYRKATKARELVEKAIMDSYPDLCEKILKRMNEGNGKS